MKLVKEAGSENGLVEADFVDEEGTTKRFSVHETFQDQLRADGVYVVHRAKAMAGKGLVDSWAMFEGAPSSYEWGGDAA